MARTHTLIVEAGRHAREATPVQIALPSSALGGGGGVRLRDASGRTVACQLERDAGGDGTLTWRVDALPAGASRRYTVEPARPDQGGISFDGGRGVELTDVPGERLEVRIGGDLITSYHYARSHARPFLYPLMGPTGASMTRHWPMVEGVEGETTDHPHHRSVWTAYGAVNGADDWLETPGCAVIRHERFARMWEGALRGGWVAELAWQEASGRTLCTETRTVEIWALPGREFLLDVSAALHASEGAVVLGDTKEGGFISVRVASSMDAVGEGRIETSEGALGEAEAWGKPAHWCDYTGPVGGGLAGIAIFDHPSNLRHPTRWMVRDYGLVTANPFALRTYLGDACADGSHTIPAGETLPFVYRLLVHLGDAARGRVGARYYDWVHPPAVRLD